jgi:hypothetical protein
LNSSHSTGLWGSALGLPSMLHWWDRGQHIDTCKLQSCNCPSVGAGSLAAQGWLVWSSVWRCPSTEQHDMIASQGAGDCLACKTPPLLCEWLWVWMWGCVCSALSTQRLERCLMNSIHLLVYSANHVAKLETHKHKKHTYLTWKAKKEQYVLPHPVTRKYNIKAL